MRQMRQPSLNGMLNEFQSLAVSFCARRKSNIFAVSRTNVFPQPLTKAGIPKSCTGPQSSVVFDLSSVVAIGMKQLKRQCPLRAKQNLAAWRRAEPTHIAHNPLVLLLRRQAFPAPVTPGIGFQSCAQDQKPFSLVAQNAPAATRQAMIFRFCAPEQTLRAADHDVVRRGGQSQAADYSSTGELGDNQRE
jgi:hypothetical protein